MAKYGIELGLIDSKALDELSGTSGGGGNSLFILGKNDYGNIEKTQSFEESELYICFYEGQYGHSDGAAFALVNKNIPFIRVWEPTNNYVSTGEVSNKLSDFYCNAGFLTVDGVDNVCLVVAPSIEALDSYTGPTHNFYDFRPVNLTDYRGLIVAYALAYCK